MYANSIGMKGVWSTYTSASGLRCPTSSGASMNTADNWDLGTSTSLSSDLVPNSTFLI